MILCGYLISLIYSDEKGTNATVFFLKVHNCSLIIGNISDKPKLKETTYQPS